jgi:hypothetical protein
LVAFQVACAGAEKRPQFFQDVLTKKGEDYVKARDAVVARGDEVRPFLKEVLQTSRDWREKVASGILLGWLDNRDLYTELWDWAPPQSYQRNPFPFYYREAHGRFSKEGEKAIPLMLELVWKKDQSQFGALPALLGEGKVGLAIPVLVRQERGYPIAMGGFGAAATPYILEVLPAAESARRGWLVQALGYTGGAEAVSELSRRLARDESTCTHAATALGRLGEFAILRGDYSKLEQLETRLAALEALGKDDSDETRAFLTKVAITAAGGKDREHYNMERLRAVQAMLDKPTDKDIAAVCSFASAEPHDYTRACFYLYLARPGFPVVREVFLKALQDRAPQGRIWAIEGLKHYPDDEVTGRVLETIEKSDDPRLHRAGVFMLKERVSPRIRKAAEEWIKDKDPEIQGWAAEALKKNGASEAGR